MSKTPLIVFFGLVYAGLALLALRYIRDYPRVMREKASAWCAKNGFELIDVRAQAMGDPLLLELQTFRNRTNGPFHVTVRDKAGTVSSGWLKLASGYFGTGPDRIVWDDPARSS